MDDDKSRYTIRSHGRTVEVVRENLGDDALGPYRFTLTWVVRLPTIDPEIVIEAIENTYGARGRRADG